MLCRHPFGEFSRNQRAAASGEPATSSRIRGCRIRQVEGVSTECGNEAGDTYYVQITYMSCSRSISQLFDSDVLFQRYSARAGMENLRRGGVVEWELDGEIPGRRDLSIVSESR